MLLNLQLAATITGVVALLAATSASADTWDEPWHDKVIRTATSFVRAKVVKSAGADHEAFEVVKQLAGDTLPEKFLLSGFNHVHPSNLTSDEEIYLFVRVGKGGEKEGLPVLDLITPTSSIVYVQDDGVISTYRHSYHQALVPEATFEQTQVAMFRAARNKPYDAPAMQKQIRAELKRPVASIASDTDAFFRQHVALELIFHLGGAKIASKTLLELLEPFGKSDEFHVQISLARALGSIPGAASRKRLCEFLATDKEGFAKAMAVWALAGHKTAEARKCLEGYLAEAETDELGFGGNLMDPRIGTAFPQSVRHAIDEALKNWTDTIAEEAEAKEVVTEKPAAPVAGVPPQPRARGCGCQTDGSRESSQLFALVLLALIACRRRFARR